MATLWGRHQKAVVGMMELFAMTTRTSRRLSVTGAMHCGCCMVCGCTGCCWTSSRESLVSSLAPAPVAGCRRADGRQLLLCAVSSSWRMLLLADSRLLLVVRLPVSSALCTRLRQQPAV